MKTIIESFLTLATAVVLPLICAVTASAETPERCILYAREYAIAAVAPAPPGSTPVHSRQSIQDAAYARCLNLGVSSLVPPGPSIQSDPLPKAAAAKAVVEAPTPVAKARPRRVVPVTSVPAFAEVDRPSGSGSSKAIAEVFGSGGGKANASIALPPVPSCSAGPTRTRFWRGGVMSPSSAGGC
jgi:hypothetical protein